MKLELHADQGHAAEREHGPDDGHGRRPDRVLVLRPVELQSSVQIRCSGVSCKKDWLGCKMKVSPKYMYNINNNEMKNLIWIRTNY